MKIPIKELKRRLKIELALRLYEKGILTFGKARKLAEMTRWDFHFLVGEAGIHRRYDVEELQKDLQILEEID
jgi:predicted HTH domain antitoxin